MQVHELCNAGGQQGENIKNIECSKINEFSWFIQTSCGGIVTCKQMKVYHANKTEGKSQIWPENVLILKKVNAKICACKKSSSLCTEVHVACRLNAGLCFKSLAVKNVACVGFHIFIQIEFGWMAVEMLQFFYCRCFLHGCAT